MQCKLYSLKKGLKIFFYYYCQLLYSSYVMHSYECDHQLVVFVAVCSGLQRHDHMYYSILDFFMTYQKT
jgi:hypothetical protein